MHTHPVTLMATGDMIVGMPQPEFFFDLVASTLKESDILIGQCEAPYTTSPFRTRATMIPVLPPDNMRVFVSMGFSVITLASNLMWNAGAPGIEDTISWLRTHNIAFTGAGLNREEAKRPVLIERSGTRIGILDYDCVGPSQAWAASDKPGVSYVRIITAYEGGETGNPGGPPTVYSFADPQSLEAALGDIRRLRPLCDLLVVVFHKGLLNTPLKLAQYEQPICHAAIDAGADLILSHHAHVLKGIEVYKGKVVFHGLGNFVSVMPSRKFEPDSSAAQVDMRRKQEAGFEPDPKYANYPWHTEAKQTMIAKCMIEGKKITRVSYLPCLINTEGQPEVLKNDARGQENFEYVEKITRGANLNAQYRWDGDEVVVLA